MVKLDLNSYTYKFLRVKYKRPTSGPALTIELIPKACQGRSLFHNWPTKWWDKLRKLVYYRANHKCEICGGGPEVECHEVWEFDIEKKIQRLKYLVCLCSKCHRAKHFGHAYLSGQGREATKHLMKINQWSIERTLLYIDLIYARHKRYRGIKFKKKLDLSLLKDFILRFQIKERRLKRVKAKNRKQKAKVREVKKGKGNYRKAYGKRN